MTTISRAMAAVACLAVLGHPRVAAAQAPVPGAPSGPATPAPAGDAQDLRQQIETLRQQFEAMTEQYEERLQALERRLAATGQSAPLAPPQGGAAPPVDQSGSAPGTAAAAANPSGSSKVFNPDTSVIGNFIASGGHNPVVTGPALELSEAEAAFQAIVDPYARADFFLSAGPGGLDVEEGFVTFTALPSNLLLKVGKMRAQFGKVNTLHTHAMPTVDRPLVTVNLVGGEEGLSDSGLSLSRLIPNPLLFLEATGEVYAGTSDVFSGSRRGRLNYVGHLRAYRDITEGSNLDLGTSIAVGPTEGLAGAAVIAPGIDLDKQLIGVDATFRYRPLRRAIYRRLNLRTELIWSRQALDGDARTTAFGAYGLAEYQFAQRWYVGGRVDRAGRAFDGSLVDTGGSVFVTFWPTEFSQIRGQYRRTNYAEHVAANELLLQFNFAIGAHGAHAF
jgi:hypothetical protein